MECCTSTLHLFWSFKNKGEEVQFFKDAYENVKLFAEKYNKRVICAGLTSDFERKPFGDVLKLITIADDVTILEKFYADQKKYAFSFQMMAYISRLALLKKTRDENPDAIIVTERSLYTDRYVFAKMLYETRDIEEVNYKIYLKWFDCFVKDYPIDKVIYVNTPPPTCLTRIIQRSRNAEVFMPISYLNKCHLYHERMIEGIYKDNTLVLDGSNDFSDIKRVWLKQVIDYITTE